MAVALAVMSECKIHLKDLSKLKSHGSMATCPIPVNKSGMEERNFSKTAQFLVISLLLLRSI